MSTMLLLAYKEMPDLAFVRKVKNCVLSPFAPNNTIWAVELLLSRTEVREPEDRGESSRYFRLGPREGIFTLSMIPPNVVPVLDASFALFC